MSHSGEDYVYKAKQGMIEHVSLLTQMDLPVPAPAANPKIIIQNEQELGRAASLIV